MPEKGFYYHYKHDPLGAVNNYAYELTGIARHTEDKTFFALYLPLYENTWFKPADYQARPLEMFMENVTKEGKTYPRFEKITDPKTIDELKRFQKELYG